MKSGGGEFSDHHLNLPQGDGTARTLDRWGHRFPFQLVSVPQLNGDPCSLLMHGLDQWL
jgi:hypothetical protein